MAKPLIKETTLETIDSMQSLAEVLVAALSCGASAETEEDGQAAIAEAIETAELLIKRAKDADDDSPDPPV